MSGDIVDRLLDLHRQATIERSHYYTGKCIEDAIGEIAALRHEIERLRTDCFEAYQAVGVIADRLGFWGEGLGERDREQILRLLDNLSCAGDGRERKHATLLPFVLTSDPAR